MENQEDESIKSLFGKTLIEIRGNIDSDKLIFVVDDGSMYEMQHFQGCCENVSIEDICGDLQDLVGSPIVRAEAPSSLDGLDTEERELDNGDACTWTFYILGTAKGTVTIRWYGTSSGLYSTGIAFYKVERAGEQ